MAGNPESTAKRPKFYWKLSQQSTCVLGCRFSGLYLNNFASHCDYRACVMLTYCNCTLGKDVGSYIICANLPRRWTRPSPQQICQWVKSVPVPPWYQPPGLKTPSLRYLKLYILQGRPQQGLKVSTEGLVHAEITTAGIPNNPLWRVKYPHVEKQRSSRSSVKFHHCWAPHSLSEFLETSWWHFKALIKSFVNTSTKKEYSGLT